MNVIKERITVTLTPVVQTRMGLLSARATRATVEMESRVQVP